MSKKPNTIFCDEAGFTGNNLLDPNSEHFVFATVNVSHENARRLVSQTIGRFKLQGNELKGSNLIKHSAGRKAIDFLLEKCVDDSKVVFFNKKYAAAAKFYEWTFDEIFGNHNTFFYVANFHRFISNALYVGIVAGDPLARAAVTDFQALMRHKIGDAKDKLFSFDTPGLTVTSLIEMVILFCYLNKDQIMAKLNPLLRDPDEYKWMLELSNTALPGSVAIGAKNISRLVCIATLLNRSPTSLVPSTAWWGNARKCTRLWEKSLGALLIIWPHQSGWLIRCTIQESKSRMFLLQAFVSLSIIKTIRFAKI